MVRPWPIGRSADQRVLENLALGATAADPGEVGERRLKDLCSLSVVAAAKRRHTRTQSGCHFAGRQAAVAG
jgi:hypothetical protein